MNRPRGGMDADIKQVSAGREGRFWEIDGATYLTSIKKRKEKFSSGIYILFGDLKRAQWGSSAFSQFAPAR